MSKIKKIIIAVAAVVLVIGIIVACELFIEHKSEQGLTYEQYNALSAEEQEEYFHSFDTVEEFFAWYNKAKQEYENNQDYIEIGGNQDINIGETGQDE